MADHTVEAVIQDWREAIAKPYPECMMAMSKMCSVTNVKVLLKAQDTAAAEAAALREALERLEWLSRFGYLACPVCGYVKEAGHRTGCGLRAALATPPSAAVQRVQGIVAAAREVVNRARSSEGVFAAIDVLRAALNGKEGE